MNILLSLRRLVAAILSLVQFFALLFSGAYAPGSGEFAKGWSNDNNGYPNSGPEVERLTEIVPSARQLAYAELEYYTFIHYGMNTFTNSEWGTGKESPSQFNPQKVDTDQWVQAVKASGSKGIIFTAKHHDGFCMFPSDYTTHDIASSPYQDGQGDIVQELAESCRTYEMQYGAYLAPWDMHEPTYGRDAYNDYFVSQLTELCTRYGELFAIWLDGAKGDDAPDFTYDFDRYYEVIRTYQPNAVIAVSGPDVRWIGNEAGNARVSEWSVVTANDEALDPALGTLPHISYDAPDMGGRDIVSQYKNLKWYPAEADVPIRPGWFWHSNENVKVKTVSTLMDIYYKTVGGNASLLLNVSPNQNGVIPLIDTLTLKAFGDRIRREFSNSAVQSFSVGSNEGMRSIEALNAMLAEDTASYSFGDDEYILDCKLDGMQQVSSVVLREDLRFSERVEDFDVYLRTAKGFVHAGEGTVIGNRKILRLPLTLPKTDCVRIVIRQSRGNPVLRSAEVFVH